MSLSGVLLLLLCDCVRLHGHTHMHPMLRTFLALPNVPSEGIRIQGHSLFLPPPVRMTRRVSMSSLNSIYFSEGIGAEARSGVWYDRIVCFVN